MWECLAKVLIPEPKNKKLGPKTFDATFIGHAGNSVAYRSLLSSNQKMA